uniref:Homologous recombination OB-fold protein OB-fold domain-containing protein n=1 Tax=Tanacetum cinerariifolium TaxID=118510 RepID=A0A699GYM8_TANCI|nr:hypothetical protein [Tanacetum cinerariifolium]
MDAKLAWLLEKYYCRSQTHIGDVYLTAEELHQLHLDEALRETLEEQAMSEKAREEKIRQKQANDDEFFLEFRVMRIDSDYDLDIDDSYLHSTPVLRSSSNARVEPSSSTPNQVRIIPGPAGTVQLYSSTCFEPSPSTSNPVRRIPGSAGLVQQAKQLKEKISATNYVISIGGTVTGCLRDINNFVKKEKLDQVVAIVKSCSPNYLGDLNVTMKDLSRALRGTVYYKVLDVGSYGKNITVGAAMILANVFVFTLKTSEHYLSIIKKNVVKVFRKDTVSLA